MFNILNFLKPVRMCKDCEHSILDIKYGHKHLTCSCMEVNKHYSEYVASPNPNNVSVLVSCFLARTYQCGKAGKYFTPKTKVESTPVSEEYRIEYLDSLQTPKSFSCRTESAEQAFDLFRLYLDEDESIKFFPSKITIWKELPTITVKDSVV